MTVPGPPAIPTALFNASAGAPECNALGAGCDSGALLVGRARLGPEANAPNTLFGSCADGTVGAFHLDESLDRLRVEAAAVDGAVQAGATVRVTATTWAFSAGDVLDLFHAPDGASPVWTFVGTANATSSGAETFSLTFPLAPAGATRQAIRGVFRYFGSRSACPAGSYDDKDDLVFAVAP